MCCVRMKCLAMALLAMLVPVPSAAAGHPAAGFARYMFEQIGAVRKDCPAEVTEEHPDKVTFCALYTSSFGIFKIDWETIGRRHDFPEEIKALSPWTLSGGRYQREYEAGGSHLTFVYDSNAKLLRAVFDQGEDLDTEVVAPEEQVRKTPLEPGFGGVTLPVLIPDAKVEPLYPQEAQHLGLEGSVTLSLIINKNGEVGEVTVLECEPKGFGFEEAAVRAVRRWLYKPSLLDGEPVKVRYTIYVDFTPDRAP